MIRLRKLSPLARIPEYAHETDAGFDLYSTVEQVLYPMQRAAISTGIALELPDNYEVQIRPRSGMAFNHGITVLNTPGTIDTGYRGEIKVILINLSEQPYKVKIGDKIAQGVVAPITRMGFIEVDSLSTSDRGEGGFGSSGV